jgi:hypothetical protein
MIEHARRQALRSLVEGNGPAMSKLSRDTDHQPGLEQGYGSALPKKLRHLTMTQPERCPACDGIAKPIHIETKVGSVIVHFRCPYCQTQWTKVTPEKPAA